MKHRSSPNKGVSPATDVLAWQSKLQKHPQGSLLVVAPSYNWLPIGSQNQNQTQTTNNQSYNLQITNYKVQSCPGAGAGAGGRGMGIHRTHRTATKPPCFCWQMEMEMGMCVVCQCQVSVVCSIIIYGGKRQQNSSLPRYRTPSVLRVIQNPFGKVIFVKKAPWTLSALRFFSQRTNNGTFDFSTFLFFSTDKMFLNGHIFSKCFLTEFKART